MGHPVGSLASRSYQGVSKGLYFSTAPALKWETKSHISISISSVDDIANYPDEAVDRPVFINISINLESAD